MPELRVHAITTDATFARTVRDVLAAQLPGAASEQVDPAKVRFQPDASALVIDARADGAQGAATATRFRAMGFGGAVIVVGAGAELDAAAREQGCAIVGADDLAKALVPRIAELVAESKEPWVQEVMRARRLVAAGGIAVKLQHSLNNPIAGIMAEAQLMQFESPTPEQAAALERIVALCRRLTDLTRSLDGFGDRAVR